MILVAEDELLTKILIEQVLTNLGFTFVLVDSGKSVIEYSNIQQFKCMLIDMQMPDVDGVEAIDFIRNKSDLNKETPIYIFSGNYPENYSELVVKYSIKGIILKPFSIDEIEKTLQQYF